MQSASYLIGRQPILNREQEIVAYELLFRSAATAGYAAVNDASHATASVIITTLSGFGLESILGPHHGYINLDSDLLMSDLLEILPKERVVLELLETLQVTPAVVARCRELKQAGFTLALDDHVYSPAFRELYELIDIVKIDLLQSPLRDLEPMIEQLRSYPVRLLAEKVETLEEFRRCLALGFELFQGFYFATPSVMERKRLDDAGASLLKLMRLMNREAEIQEIEQAFRGSPGLTYKLLMLVNSVSFGLREKIQTVRHAIALLGRQQIKRWVQLALFASDDSRGTENPLVDMAAVRAAFMEQLSLHHPELKGVSDASDKAFMVGILSLLEALYDISPEEVASSLNLSEEIRLALIARQGALGTLLRLTESIESMNLAAALDGLEQLGISQEDVLAAQVKAYGWRGGMV